jgi:hypothetical protein
VRPTGTRIKSRIIEYSCPVDSRRTVASETLRSSGFFAGAILEKKLTGSGDKSPAGFFVEGQSPAVVSY